MPSTAIVYYSLEGNTSYVAELLAQKTGAELIRLETVKEYPKTGFLKFFCGGRDATFSVCPELKNALPDFSRFSTIIIGTPVWAGKPSAPVNAFLHKAHYHRKTHCAVRMLRRRINSELFLENEKKA
jgi:flavodoxin